MFDRREMMVGIGTAMLAGCNGKARTSGQPSYTDRFAAMMRQLPAIEAKVGGRLGVAIHDTNDGAIHAFRGNERFPMCSTFKFPLCGAVLRKVDMGELQLEDLVTVKAADIVPHSPVTEKAVGGSLSIAAMCEATMTLSDNAAANLLLAKLGGIAEFNSILRNNFLDDVTRLNRLEPFLNEATPGDPRDTTSPKAMAFLLHSLLIDWEALSLTSRERLTSWLVANKTGDAAIRAGVPTGWRVGDKTGAGDHGTRNDIAILWPPQRKPILLAVYYTENNKTMDARNAVIAEVARTVTAAI